MNYFLLAVQPVNRKITARVNILQCGQFDQELAAVSLTFLNLSSERKILSQTENWRHNRLKTLCFLDDMEYYKI